MVYPIDDRAPPTTLQQQTYCELFHQTIHKHATHKTNRSIDRATQNIQGYNITLTTAHVQGVIKQSKNNNSQGPDKLNIRHLLDSHSSRECLKLLLTTT